MLQRVKVAEPSDIGRDPPVVEVVGCLIQLLVLQHWSNDAFLKPGREGLDQLASHCGLSIDVKDVRGTPRTVTFCEPGDRAVVQQLDPFDRPVDAIAVADGETGEAFVFFVSRGYLLPGLFLEPFEPLMKVGDGLYILLLLLVMDPVPLSNGLYEGLSEVAEPDWVSDVKTLDEVSCGGRRDGVGMGNVEVGSGHEDGGRGRRRAVWGHRDVGVWGVEWKGIG